MKKLKTVKELCLLNAQKSRENNLNLVEDLYLNIAADLHEVELKLLSELK